MDGPSARRSPGSRACSREPGNNGRTGAWLAAASASIGRRSTRTSVRSACCAARFPTSPIVPRVAATPAPGGPDEHPPLESRLIRALSVTLRRHSEIGWGRMNDQDSRNSTLRERIVEHVFVGDALRRLWRLGITDVEVLRSEFDARGYDLVLSFKKVVR